MRAQLLLATALSSTMAVLVPGHAAAQDLQHFDWSGFYVGASAGLVQSADTAKLDYPAGGAPLATTGFGVSGTDLYLNGTDLRDSGLPTLFRLDSKGRIAGLDAGYNVQAGQFVFGFETDLSGLGGTAAARTSASPSGLTTVDVTTTLDGLMTARARAGVAVDRLMFFATAGLAVGHTSLSSDLHYDNGKSAAAAGASGGWVPGIVAGLGAEYALSDKVSLKAEGLYYRLAGDTTTATGAGKDTIGGPLTMQPYAASDSPSGVILRAGINFHF